VSAYVTAVIGRDQFERCLAAADEVGTGVPLVGLAAPLDATWVGRISEAWDVVAAALRQAFEHGADMAGDAVDAAVRAAESCVRGAGNRARDVHQALLVRAQTYIGQLVDEALAQVRPSISVGEHVLLLQSVELAHEVTMSGSLKAAITELVSITAEGRLAVSAIYAAH
jgi:hypothetical protein